MNSTASYLESETFYEPFATTLAGFLLPMITGLVSATSSSLILYVIFKSDIKLSSTYHRIMAFMSFCDIISSIFIALGTIMMPSDNMFPFAGPMLGNQVTCQMQAWLIMAGVSGTTCLNACLCWYFVCKITFQMDAERIARCIEPTFYTFVSLISLIFPSFYLAKDLLDVNVYDNFCTVIPYPERCDEIKWYDWNNCEWGEGVLQSYFTNLRYLTMILSILFVLIVLGITIILWTIFRTNQRIEHLIAATVHEKSQVMAWDDESKKIFDTKIHELSDLKYSRVLIYQALMYVAAFLSTWTFIFLSVIFDIAGFELDAINSVLFPLQGFWNLFIFLIDKTYLIRLNQKDSITFSQAVLRLMKSPEKAPVFVLSNISTAVEEENSDDVIPLPMARYYATKDVPLESNTPGDSAPLDPSWNDLSPLSKSKSSQGAIHEDPSPEISLRDLSPSSARSSSPRDYHNSRKSFRRQ